MAIHEFHGATGKCHVCNRKVKDRLKICDKCKKERKKAWQGKYYKVWYARTGGRVCAVCRCKINSHKKPAYKITEVKK